MEFVLLLTATLTAGFVSLLRVQVVLDLLHTEETAQVSVILPSLQISLQEG